MANSWDQYVDYDSQPTVAARLAMARQLVAELSKVISPSYKGDGLEVSTFEIRQWIKDIKADIKRYIRSLGRTSGPVAVNRTR